MPRKREGPGGTRGDRACPHFCLTLSPPTKTCVACPISHFSSIDTYNTDTAVATNRMYQDMRECLCMYACKWFCCSWWRVHSDGRHDLIVVQERERMKEGVVCTIGGWRRVVCREGDCRVRVEDARARGDVLAATRVVERERSLSEERRDEEERGDFSSGALVVDCPLLRTVLHHHRHRA